MRWDGRLARQYTLHDFITNIYPFSYQKIEDLRATVEDLEALKELADELEENHMETEKQLQAEIDHRDMLLRGQMERLASAEETNADYENTISQFRELVLNLQKWVHSP